MIGKKWVIAALVLLVAGLFFWLSPSDQHALHPQSSAPTGPAKPSPTGPAPLAPAPEVIAPRTEKVQPPYVNAKSKEDIPAEIAKKDFYAKARVLKERITPPDANGKFEKKRLIQTTEKYPYVRVEEKWHHDAATGQDVMDSQVAMVADHLVARLQDGRETKELTDYVTQLGGSIRRQLPNQPVYLIQLPSTEFDEFDRMLQTMRQGGTPLKYAEPDFLVHASMVPNDPGFSQLWGLNNTGQTGGVGDADIDAPEAWDASTGSTSVVVAIIDTGIDYTHPDLAANMWTNPNETPGNGTDDDHNGYVDDVRGWNFVANTNDPMDDHYHGTHCAGTIGAVGNNGIGVVGVCPTVKLMPLKFLSSSGSGYTSDAVEAVNYATAKNVTIMSNSWGGGGYSQALKDAIDAAQAAGILFVAAAGNDGVNTDLQLTYPADYASANIVSVAATDASDTLAYFSNYGVNSVHLGAPGVSIYSTSPGGGYRTLSGTSMACPHVSGAAALIKAARPSMSWNDVRAALLNNVDVIPALTGKSKSGGRLNVARALIIATDPYVSMTALHMRDGQGNGANGNNDGVINPGEDIALDVTLKNVGALPAANATSQISLTSASTGVTIVQGTQSWGSIPVGGTVSNTSTPFVIRIAAGVTTPYPFTLRLTTTDSANHSWTSDASFTVLTNSTVSGHVTATTGGTGIGSAVVAYSGPSSGSTTTAADGSYSLKLTDGTYNLHVSASGYNPAADVSVTVPPSHTAVDFQLGRSRLQVTPTSLASTQYEDRVVQKTLTISNSGDQPLTFWLTSSSGATSSDFAATPQFATPLSQKLEAAGPQDHGTPPPLDAAAAGGSSLPFEDGFEGGSLANWTLDAGTGAKEIVNSTAAEGTKSLHLLNQGPDSHFTGIHKDIVAGSKPQYASFWVRAASTTNSSGYFVMMDGGVEAIWFFARSNGAFYVNGDLAGGDNSVPYTANVWYHIEFRNLNWATKTFDYYVNGALMKAQIPFRNAASVNEITQVYLYNFSQNSEAWWDDVRVLQDPINWLSYSPATLTVPAGQAANVTVTFNSTGMAEGTYPGRIGISSNDPANPLTTVPATLTVQLSPNSPPVANNQTVTINEDNSAFITLTGTDADGDPLTAQVTSLPAVGTLYQTPDGAALGTPITTIPAVVTNPAFRLIYVPPPDANGAGLGTFQFVLKDKRSTSNTATVTVNVTAVNDLPVAVADWATGLPGQTIASIPVLANDSDPDGDTLTISSFTQGAHGAVANNGNGTLSYTPNSGFSEGTDLFTYTISDGHGGTASATVSVTLGYLAGGAWPTYGNGLAHTGYYPATLGRRALSATWTLPFAQTPSQAALADGKAFVTNLASTNSTLSAVDLATGTITWQKSFASAYSLNPPTYDQGQIFVQRGNASDSQLWCVDAVTGNTVWSAPFSAQWESYFAPLVTSSAVYVDGGTYGGLYGYNRNTGTQLFFNSTLDQYDQWTPGLYNGGLYSFVAGKFRNHNVSTGVVNWTVDLTWYWTGYDMNRAVAFDGGKAFMINNKSGGNEVVCIDLNTHAVLWRAQGNYSGTPAVASGKVYVITGTASKVQALDATTGSVLADYPTGTVNGVNQPIVTNDTLFVGCSSNVYVIDLASKALIQNIPFGGNVSLSNGRLVISPVPGGDNMLRCYAVTGGSNHAPLAQTQTATCVEDNPVTITLDGSDADGDPLIAIIASLPAKGTLYQTADGTQVGQPITVVPALVKNPQRKVIYRPAPDGFGTAYTNFTFKTNDGTISSAAATVTVNVTPVNDAPIAVNDRIYLRAGNQLDSFFPQANDIDADGDVLTITNFTQPANGMVSSNADGSLKYVPNPSFTEGTDTFQYTIRDAGNVAASATVEIVVSNSFGRDWPTFGNGPDHTNRYPGSLGTQPFVQRWSQTIGTTINPLAVAEGKIFYTVTGNWNNYMYAFALDANTGAEVWRSQFNPGNSLNPPTYYKGSVYVQRGNSTDTQIWALNSADGTPRWQTPHGAQWEHYMAPAVNDQGVFIDGGYYGGIYGFDRTTGAQKFFLGLDQYDGWTPSLFDGGLYSFMVGKFRSHDINTGAVNWTLDFGWNWAGYTMNRTVAFDSGHAYLINDSVSGNELICVDLASHTILWRTSAAFKGTPAVANGLVYALAGGVVKTYGASSGQWLGDFTATGETALANAPVVTNDLLLAASTTKTYIFNLASRQLQQTIPFGSQITIAGDVLYLSCADNTIRAYGRTVTGNTAPVAKNAQVTIPEDAEVAVQLEATDANSDPLSFVIRSLPAQGTLYQTVDGVTKGAVIANVPTLVQGSAGTVIYKSALNVNGAQVGSFTFTAHDASASSNTATVRIDITPVNDPPVAIPDVVALRPGEVLTNFHPEANDRDPDGDVLKVVSFTQGASGTVTQSADGSLQYAPNAGFTSGTDSFNYTIQDAGGLQSSSTVSIIVSSTLARTWPTFGAGPDHTAYVPINLGTQAFTQQWSNNLGKPAYQLAVADNKVFASLQIYSADSSLVALAASSGGEAWRVNFTGGAYMNAPTWANGDVLMQYSNSSSSRLYALNSTTGATHWTAPFSAQWEQYLAPAVDSTGVYVDGGTYGGLYGFGSGGGAQLFFNNTLEQYDQWTPTIYNGGLYTFIQGKFRGHNKATGAVLWTIDYGWNWAGYSMKRTSACANNRAYFINDSVTIPAGSQDLTAVDLTSHATAWQVRGSFTGTPALAHQSVFVIAGGKAVNVYDALTGAFLKSYTLATETGLTWQPIVTNDAVIASSGTATYIFDLRTGQLRQTIPFGGYVSLAGNNLYIASADNIVRAYAVPDALNHPPAAVPLTLSTPEDTPVAVSLQGTDADSDPLTFVVTRLPTVGTLYQTTDGTTRGAALTAAPALVTNAPPRVIYVSPQDRNGNGLGNFGYAASDGKGLSPEAAVVLNVQPVNDPPVAVNDVRYVQPGQILSPIRETLNDIDVDGDPFTTISFTQPAHGTVIRNSDGTLRYEQAKDAGPGTEQFSYTIADPSGAQSTGTVTIVITPEVQGLWTMFGNGTEHTGYAPTTLGRTGWVQRWSYQAGTTATQVAVAEGKIFVSANPYVAALQEKSGTELWKKSFNSAFSLNPPSYFNGKVFVQRCNNTPDTQMIALNVADGSTAWNTTFGSQWEHYLSPAVSSLGVFIDGGTYGGLYGFNGGTGVQTFFRTMAQTDSWTPAITGSELYSFVNGQLISHNSSTGANVWSLNLGWGGWGYSMNRTVAINGRSAFLINESQVASYTQDLVCANLDSHTTTWSVNGKYQGTPAVNNGLVYALSGNTVEVRAALDGHLISTFAAPAGEYLAGQPLLTDDAMVAQSSLKTYVFGRYDRALLQTINRGGSMSVADDQLIVSGTDGVVAAYAAQPAVTFTPNGGTFNGPADIVLSANEPGGLIYYTVDGSAPNLSSPSVASGSTVRINWTGKIRAILVIGSAISRINEADIVMVDTDHDNLPDWWEMQVFHSLTATDGKKDSDGDGVSDFDEFIAGTNPLDASDHLLAGDCAVSRSASGTITVSWPSKADRYYIVEKTSDLTTWSPQSSPIVGNGQTLTYQCSSAGSAAQFYRVRVMPQMQEQP